MQCPPTPGIAQKKEKIPLFSIVVLDLHTNLGWCTLKNRLLDSKLVMFLKCQNIPSIQIIVSFQFFPHNAVLWNWIPHHIVALPDVEQFKQAVAQLDY